MKFKLQSLALQAKRKNRSYAYSSKIYLAEVTLPLRILMALSHGSEKDNKKTANLAVI